MPSDSDDEDFVTYGTPLEPLREDEVPSKKPFTLEDQVVRDKQGRRRFHGAFTGGFSAGFFNSVGSLEGWTPSQFKSSRAAKAQPNKQKAEDFMDEEDMDEFGIAPKVLQTTSDYSSEKKESRKRMMSYYDGPIPGEPVLHNILRPVRETVGMKILIKMGWKPGQGVGPRVSKTEKQRTHKEYKKTGVKIYGCSLPDQPEKEHVTRSESSASENEVDNDEYKNITFAPDDYEAYVVKPKDNYFGIGYCGLDRKSVLSNRIDLFGSSLVIQDKKKKLSVRGQAFGVGVLEEEDEDIYAKEDMSQYDFALECKSTLTEMQREGQRKSHLAIAQASSKSGSLEGFVQASVATIRKKYFPLPQLPPTFNPQHKIRKSRFEDKFTGVTYQKKKGLYAYNLTANDRAVLVNEVPIENRENMEMENTSQTKNMSNTKDESVIERSPCGIFKPFVADPDKQERYEKYLCLKKLGQIEKLKTLQPLNMTEWECEREKTEFEQASRLFKPLSTEFSDRFVSASQPDDATNPLAVVQRTTDAKSEMVNAAKMKMFGCLTREVLDWTPNSIVFKRFNIAEPGTRSGTTSSTNQKPARPKFSVFNFLESAPFNVYSSEPTASSSQESDNISAKTDDITTIETEKVIESEENNENKSDLLVLENAPKIDLYKAIFLSSSEDESESEGNSKANSVSYKSNIEDTSDCVKHSFTDLSSETSLQQTDTSKVNVLRNTSPPRGVFANLDLDAINSWTKKSETVEDRSNKTMTETVEDRSNKTVTETDTSKIITESEKLKIEEIKNESHLIYGPSLPSVFPDKTVLPKTTRSQSSTHIDSDREWVELKSETKHKHKKKHSKKSHKKEKRHKDTKKHKHKKKKK